MKWLLIKNIILLLQTAFSVQMTPVEEQYRIQQLQLRAQQLHGRTLQQIQQITKQRQQILNQQRVILQREKQEEFAKRLQEQAFKDAVLPDVDDVPETNEKINMEYVGLSNQVTKLSPSLKKLTVSREEYSLSLTPSTSLKKNARRSNQWGEWSCCRRVIGIQTRERYLNSKYIQVQPRDCSWDFCNECVDDLEICSLIGEHQNGCHPSSTYKGFMSRHCPETCGWCNPVSPSAPLSTTFTTTTATSPPATTTDPNIRAVYVHLKGNAPIYNYQFTMSSPRPKYPWKSITQSQHSGEVKHFRLYSRPSRQFSTRIYFCKAYRGVREKWLILRRPCSGGWKQEMILYASPVALPGTERISVANRGKAPWTSRLYKGRACCGYTKKLWSFFAPTQSIKPTKTTSPSKSPSPTSSTVAKPTKPTTPSSKQPSTPFQRECLETHNFFRALHGAPPLRWDSAIAATAQRWANYLADHAPEYPFKTAPNFKRTSHWPHSAKPSQYRGRGVGENIAWDFSTSGSPAKESVLRWYSEIFDYNEENPTHSEKGKPVGHYTQLLWKQSTHLGCGVAIVNIQRGSFTYKSTYTVSHYAPAGNLRYPTFSGTLGSYTRNVPKPIQGTCMSSPHCSADGDVENRCMGFNRKIRCRCARSRVDFIRGRPKCVGSGGCLVVCRKPPQLENRRLTYLWENECRGQRLCECLYKPKNGRAGANCI